MAECSWPVVHLCLMIYDAMNHCNNFMSNKMRSLWGDEIPRPYPLAGLRPIRLRVEDVIVRVVMLPILVAKHVEGLPKDMAGFRCEARGSTPLTVLKKLGTNTAVAGNVLLARFAYESVPP